MGDQTPSISTRSSGMENERANPLIFALVCCFASCSWLGANSIWVELTIFTQTQPEGWKLGSVLDVVIQLASVGAIVFMILDRGLKLPIPHAVVIQLSLVVCALGNLPLAFGWRETAWIFGSSHSVVILGTAFVLGMINVGSDIVWMPFMIKFKNAYLPAYWIGSGLSAVIPSLLSIAQGASSYECVLNNATGQSFPHFFSPRFSISAFYSVLFVWASLACVSFYAINWQVERLEHWFPQTIPRSSVVQSELIEGEQTVKPDSRAVELSPWKHVFILAALALLGIEMNTVVPSLQSYASLPFSSNAYFWSLTLSALAQPVGALVAQFVKIQRFFFLIFLSAITGVCTVLYVLIAAQSPAPFLAKTTAGSVMSVLLAVSIESIGCFLRTALLETFRDSKPNDRSRLFWGGLSLQAGSFAGTLLMYPLVNVWKLFKDAPAC